MAAPVKMHEEIEVSIDSLAYGGNGVGRLNGFVVFVRRGLPGDRVRARITKVKRGFAEALATEVLEPSPDRVDAPCEHFPTCGGCRFQDLDYAVQVAAKEAQIRDALVRIGGIAEPPLEPILPAASPFFYRNKLEYSFTQTEEGPALGFHRAGRWDEVLPVDRQLGVVEGAEAGGDTTTISTSAMASREGRDVEQGPASGVEPDQQPAGALDDDRAGREPSDTGGVRRDDGEGRRLGDARRCRGRAVRRASSTPRPRRR